jgi:wyosine [tRNA(Phe)-imidazoG37] synthetase (radical SAM superfamily)
MISFGPIPSRRLGKSLGINNIPSQKVCSFSCSYCQVGITKKYSKVRSKYYEPKIISSEVRKHLNKLKDYDKPDYLTFVANGEPTLDINLGESIEMLKQFNIPIAVITNSSLLNYPDVRADLNLADWVSVKVDTNDPIIWQLVNRPIPSLKFETHLKGLLEFSATYKGKLATETMLVKGLNDQIEFVLKTSELVKQLNPMVSYISVPTRPPALPKIKAPEEIVINEAFQIFTGQGLNVELLLGFEGTNTGFTGNAIEDIINICTVHPIRNDTMMELLKKNKADMNVLKNLINSKYIKQVYYKEESFYIRQFHV